MISSCQPRWMMAAVAACALVSFGSSVHAQVAFPAPLPGQAAAPPPQQASTSAFPPISGSAPMKPMNTPLAFPSQGVAPMGQGFSSAPSAPAAGPSGGSQADCMKGFAPLKAEAEKRAEVIKAMSKRKAPANEACKAIGAFSQSEVKMINYIKTNAQRCGIPPQVAEQMAQGHKGTEQMRANVCNAAQQQAQQPRGAAMSLSEALGAGVELPEAKPTKRNGGSTFDTLSGNVLAR
ncbi:conserved hypothetical protein [Afipia carboxidovorans OM5]|uniref:Uncharacterized protein n=1 Tax=Afipia carboxidovorans (strain ATCC 49405 / DSM 1227 / KCTC 32145 / OM5) TaxID=504832 RepID=B6JIY6_AFIC5|nr:hypothetical protein [Afipia carboxidovorans]ACI94363.1 conserved hypothetical protein [Afipia carboxidovorans OM5]AEI02002.1 hypothetical protein OCA4_c08550 [Afipia carboxidovorans OM4]AEI05578.1 hypothetical protein OCA5_c08560 [Afipia carboxidovorans OM5]